MAKLRNSATFNAESGLLLAGNEPGEQDLGSLALPKNYSQLSVTFLKNSPLSDILEDSGKKVQKGVPERLSR